MSGHRSARGESGQTAVEYLGVIAVVTAIVIALIAVAPSIGTAVATGLNEMICRVAGEGCESSVPARAEDPSDDGADDEAAASAADDPDAGTDQGPAEEGEGEGEGEGESGGEGEDDDDEGLVLIDADELEAEDLVDVDTGIASGDVTFSEHLSGILVFLYSLCEEDLSCVRSEIGGMVEMLEEEFPDLDTEALMDAFDPERDDLREMIEQIRDDGGCANLRVEKKPGLGRDPTPPGQPPDLVPSGRLNNKYYWRYRESGSGDDCFGGTSLQLADAEDAADRAFEIAAGRDGVEVTIGAETTAGLMAAYDLAGGDIERMLDGIRAYEEENDEQVLPSEGIPADLLAEALKPENHDDLAAAIEATRGGDECLGLAVAPEEGGGLGVEWSAESC